MGKFDEAIAALPKERLISYLPKELLAELKNSVEVKPSYITYSAAMLYVDVSGFSNIAHKLNNMVAGGAETLTNHLNIYFTKIIDIIGRHGGDIILFSGDALLVSWSSDVEEELMDKSVSCILCGVNLSKNCAEHRFSVAVPNGDDIVLEMNLHIGAAYGSAMGAIVGGASPHALGMWKYIVMGRVVECSGVAANLGNRGSFIIARSLLQSQDQLVITGAPLSEEVDGEIEEFVIFETVAKHKDADEGSFSTLKINKQTLDEAQSKEGVGNGVPVPPSPRQTLADYTPVDSMVDAQSNESEMMRIHLQGFAFDTLVYSELDHFLRETKAPLAGTNANGAAAQLRIVSTLFIKLHGISVNTSDYAMLHAKLQRATRIIQKALVKVDGVLNKIIMDDKGVICVCVFGIPHHSHEDDALRSVVFAHKVSSKLSKEVGSTTVGICRSYVFCGTTGSAARKEYTVLGDGVNMAARLMAKCDSVEGKGEKKRDRTIMCDWDTANEAGRSEKSAQNVGFVDAGELKLKGREQAIACFYVVAASEKDRIAREMSSNNVSPHHQGLVRAQSMCSQVSKSSKVTSGTSMSSRSSISSFGSLFSLPRMFQANAASQSRRRMLQQQRSQSVLSPIQQIASVRSGGSLRSLTMSEGNQSLHSIHSAQSMSKLRHQLDGITARKDEVEQLKAFIDTYARPRRSGASPSNNTVTVRTRGTQEGNILAITGQMQTGKTKFLKYAQELLDRRQCEGIILYTSESSMHAQYDSLRPLVQSILANTDFMSLAADVDTEDLNMLSYVCRDDRIGLPTEDQSNLSRKEKMDTVNNVLQTLMASAFGWPVMLLVDDIKLLDYATTQFVVWSVIERGCSLIYTDRVTGSKVDNSMHLPSAAATSTQRRSEGGISPLPGLDTLSHSTGSDSGPVAMLDFADTARKEDTADLRKRLLQFEHKYIRLEAMSRSQHDKLLIHLFLHDVDPFLSEKIYEKTGGIPGFTSQICTNLISGNHVSVRNSQVVVVKKGRLEETAVHFVKGLEAHVLAIVDQLSEEARIGIHVAAVLQIDNRFGLDIFTTIMERLNENAESALATLVSVNMLMNVTHREEVPEATPHSIVPQEHTYAPSSWLDKDSSEHRVTFCQQLSRDAVYLSMLQAVRKQYHSLAADVIMEKERGETSRLKASTSQHLFYHISRSGQQVPFKYCYAAFISAIECNRIELATTYLESVADGAKYMTPYEELMLFFNKLACVNEMGREEDFLEPGNIDAVLDGVQQYAREHSIEKISLKKKRPAKQKKAGLFSCCCAGDEEVEEIDLAMTNRTTPREPQPITTTDDGTIGRYGEGVDQDLYARMSAYSGRPLTDPTQNTDSSKKRAGQASVASGDTTKFEVTVLYYSVLAELRFARGDKKLLNEAVKKVMSAHKRLSSTDDYDASSSCLAINLSDYRLDSDVDFLLSEKSRTAQAREAQGSKGNSFNTGCIFGAMASFRFPNIIKLLSTAGYATLQHEPLKTLAQLPGHNKVTAEPVLLVIHGRFRLSLHGLVKSLQVVGCILQGEASPAKQCINELRCCGSPKWALAALQLKNIAKGFMTFEGSGGYSNTRTALVNKMHQAGLVTLAADTQNSLLMGCGFDDILMESLHIACTKSEISLGAAVDDLEAQLAIPTPHFALALMSVMDRILTFIKKDSTKSTGLPSSPDLGSVDKNKTSSQGTGSVAGASGELLQRCVKMMQKVGAWYPVFEPVAVFYEGARCALKSPATAKPSFELCIELCARLGMKRSIFMWRARAHLTLSAQVSEAQAVTVGELLATYTSQCFHSPIEYELLEEIEALGKDVC